jgi:hypothetical protein
LISRGVIVLCVLASCACYDPNFVSGKVLCGGPTKTECPSGFECSSCGTCVRSGDQFSCSDGGSPTGHTVALSWERSKSPNLAGYRVYRSTTSGGPYTVLTTSLVSSTDYTDASVQNGATYYYVARAVDQEGIESVASNEAVARIPAQ